MNHNTNDSCAIKQYFKHSCGKTTTFPFLRNLCWFCSMGLFKMKPRHPLTHWGSVSVILLKMHVFWQATASCTSLVSPCYKNTSAYFLGIDFIIYDTYTRSQRRISVVVIFSKHICAGMWLQVMWLIVITRGRDSKKDLKPSC